VPCPVFGFLACKGKDYISRIDCVTGERGTRTESRELAAGVDGNSGAGADLERTATRWRGRARRKTRLFVIPTGVVARAGT
jgi:hypothetical protein